MKTIYFIQGSSDIIRLYRRMVLFLEHSGYYVIIAQVNSWSSLEVQAENICRDIKKRDLNEFFIVSISLGSTVAKLVLDNPLVSHKIKKVIAICSPFRGTWMALPLFFIPSYRQIIPGSRMLKQLQSKSTNNYKIVSIRPMFDTEIIPLSSEILPGAKNIQIGVIGHIFAPYTKKMLNAVKNELN